jgi:hypothetical protein
LGIVVGIHTAVSVGLWWRQQFSIHPRYYGGGFLHDIGECDRQRRRTAARSERRLGRPVKCGNAKSQEPKVCDLIVNSVSQSQAQVESPKACFTQER